MPSKSCDHLHALESGILRITRPCNQRFLHLLATKDESLLNWWDTLLLLNTLLYASNFVVWLDVELDLLAGEGADSVKETDISIFVEVS
jgi:hypothetical protein